MADSKKLIEQIQAAAGKRQRPSRSNRTVALKEPGARIFFHYCKYKGWYAQEVLDMLIEKFLEEIKDDLPSELVPKKDDGAA